MIGAAGRRAYGARQIDGHRHTLAIGVEEVWHRDGRFVMEDRKISGVDYEADALRAQRQFEGLIARYPDRTFGHPDVTEIFSTAYPVVARPE